MEYKCVKEKTKCVLFIYEGLKVYVLKKNKIKNSFGLFFDKANYQDFSQQFLEVTSVSGDLRRQNHYSYKFCGDVGLGYIGEKWHVSWSGDVIS